MCLCLCVCVCVFVCVCVYVCVCVSERARKMLFKIRFPARGTVRWAQNVEDVPLKKGQKENWYALLLASLDLVRDREKVVP